MSEDDVAKVITSKIGMIGSDGLFFDTHPHPRLWGTFPRILAKYCRDENKISLTEAIHKMTAIPAKTFGFNNRGIIKVGYFADIVIFNFNNIKDNATFQEPTLEAEGIVYVLVNGELSYTGKDKVVTEKRAGRLLLRNKN